MCQHITGGIGLAGRGHARSPGNNRSCAQPFLSPGSARVPLGCRARKRGNRYNSQPLGCRARRRGGHARSPSPFGKGCRARGKGTDEGTRALPTNNKGATRCTIMVPVPNKLGAVITVVIRVPHF